MADWSESSPTLSTPYTSVLTMLRDRDKDAAKMFVVDPTNPLENMIRYNRSLNKFQEYLSAVWTDKVLSVAGGGTGGATAAAARTALGIGTMGTQESNAVAITGGTISGLTSLAVSGAVTFSGGLTAGSGAVGIIDSTGKIPALSATYLASLSAAALTNIPAAQLSGTVPTANLGSGTANATTFLRGDQAWAAPIGTVPSGMIAIFDVACPAGWTRVAAFDGKMIRGASSYGATGGADTHQHSITAAGGHTHPISGRTASEQGHEHAVSGTTAGPSDTQTAQAGVDGPFAHQSHTHGIAFNTSAGQAHDHAAGTLSADSGGGHDHGALTGFFSTLPAYISVVFCKKD